MDNNQSPQEKGETKDIRFDTPTFIDPLTGMFNRYYLYQFLPEEIQKAKLGNYPLSFLMIDLDGFKKINDTYGHLCGDEVLKQFAKIFKKRIRATDAVIRYAGDEFALLLPTADAEKAKFISEQLIHDVQNAEFKASENQVLHCTLSIGFAIYPTDADEVYKLIDMADKALYLSKHKGRNRVSYAEEVTLEEVSSLVAMDSFPCPIFIDRDQELNRLKQIYDIVNVSNLLQAVCVYAPAGAGKSRLLNEIGHYLKDKVTVIHCNGLVGHTQDPYHAFAMGIGVYLDEIKVDSHEARTILSKMPFEELRELSLLMPQLANLVEKPQRSAFDNKARFLLFKSFLDFLFELNKISIITMLVDDVQYFDKASLELLRYLIKQEKNKRIYVVCSLNQDKSEEIAKDNNLYEVWPEIKLCNNFIEISLGNLSLDNLAKMINTIFLGLGDSKGFVELIYNTTGGNPCFVEEILKSLLESGFVIYQDNHWRITKEITIQDIPASLKDVVKRRIRNLDEETKEMILQAAVIGEDFNVDLLRKMGNKDQGFIFEMINRAKKMRLVDERVAGNFQFANKNVQDALYNELNEAQRKNLHYKVAQALAEQHKDNLYNVAGELAFHFSRAPQQEDAIRSGKVFSEMSSELFDSYEIVESLKMLARDIVSQEEERVIVEITDEVKREVFKFIRSIMGTIKNFRLYPPYSSIRAMSAKESYDIINDILNNKNVERIDISEIEKSLVINAKRILPKELQGTNIEDFLYIIMDRNIKNVSFDRGLQEKEIGIFVEYLSADYQEVMGKGTWVDLFKKEGITHIRVDEIRLAPSGRALRPVSGEKAKMQDAMLMEFLLGKLDHAAVDKTGIIKTMRTDPQKLAGAITEIAENLTAQGQAKDKTQVVSNLLDKMHSQVLTDQPGGNYIGDLAKVILELEPMLRSKVIRSKLDSADTKGKEIIEGVISSLPDEVIVDIIAEEYRDNPNNLLTIKDFIKEVVPDDSRRKEVIPKLETKLSQLNVDKEEISFIADKLKWEEMPVDKKINSLIKASSDGTFTVEKSKIAGLLQQLDALHKKEELESGIYRLLSLYKELNKFNRRELFLAITDFVKMDFSSDAYGSLNRIECLLKKLKVETDQEIFKILLDIFKDIISDFVNKLSEIRDILELDKPEPKKYSLFVNRLFCILQERLKPKEERGRLINDAAKNFILDISRERFLDILIYSLINSSAKETYDIKEIYQIIGDTFIDALINLGTEKITRLTDLFKRYVFQTKIIKILIELGDNSINRLKLIADEANTKQEVNPTLIELMGYLKNENLLDNIVPFLNFKDPLVRRSAILALGEIATTEAQEILSSIAKNDKDKSIRLVATEQLRKIEKT